MATCPSCGTENPDRAKFCLECGSTVGPAPVPSHGARKLVTVLFADVVGSTALGEQLDPETLRAVLTRYFAAARTVLERHGGTVEKFIGDAVMAVFGVPLMHEDDALRAVRAAIELRDEIALLNDELSRERGMRIDFRIGVNTGEVVAGAGGNGAGSLVTGDAVNVAARLEQNAAAGEVLIGEQTQRLTRDFVETVAADPVAAKGKSAPVRAYRLVRLSPAASDLRARAGTAFFGRRRELARLSEALEDVRLERRCHLFTLLGSAGVGKSRLVAQFLDSTDDVTVLRGQCLSYGEGITYWPIASAIRTAAGIDEDSDAQAAQARIAELVPATAEGARIADLVSSAVGLGRTTAAAEELFWGVRRFFEITSARAPLVLVIEDLHWAEPTLLDLLEHIADWARDAPILLLCTARPELLESRPTWSGGKVNATTILLEALSREQTAQLVRTLGGGSAMSSAVLDQIVDTAEGNPLFAEEIARMLTEDDGDLRTPEFVMDRPRIPTSVQAVIAARLERLPTFERVLAQRAAVAGRVFERGAVVALLDDEQRSGVGTALLGLVRKELVHPERAEVTADEAFRFRHLLIRDSAYDGLPKTERSDLHGRFAAWLEEVVGDRIAEYAEIVGYHYESAHRYRLELGLDDPRSAELSQRAGRHLLDAGRQAAGRGDPDGALKLLERAVTLLPPTDERLDAQLARIYAAIDAEHWDEARTSSAHLLASAGEAGNELMGWKGRLLHHFVLMWSDPTYSAEALLADVAAARPIFEAAGDDDGLTLLESMIADVHLTAARWEAALDGYRLAISHAIRAGDERRVDDMRAGAANAALWGPTPVGEVIAMADRELAEMSSRPARARIHNIRALAHAMNGDADRARDDVASALALRMEVHGNAASVFTAGPVEQTLGDLRAADESLGRTAAALAAQGETGGRSTIVAARARVAFDLGDIERAAELAAEGRALSSADDAVSQAMWRQAAALVAARSGALDEAQRLIADATEIAARTDFLVLQGQVEQDRGRILAEAGDREGTRRAFQRALELFERKGDVADAGRMRAALERL